MRLNCLKIMFLCVGIVIIFSSCGDTNKNNPVEAYREHSILEYNVVEKRSFWFYDNFMDKDYLSDMTAELEFANESDAKDCFNKIIDDYKDYPQYNFVLDGEKIIYFPAMQSHWINSYKRADVIKTLEDNGYTITVQ